MVVNMTTPFILSPLDQMENGILIVGIAGRSLRIIQGRLLG
jgi:hypothetical protein